MAETHGAPVSSAAYAGRGRQGAIGVALAAGVIGGWLVLHVLGVFALELSAAAAPLAVAVILAQCWLSTGLFIVAHDAMHGSLAPGRPAVNRWVGRLALALYAGFDYDRLRIKHFDHHRRPGTPDDPDFDHAHPSAAVPWYLAFFREYFGWREFAILTAVGTVYVLVLGAPIVNVLAFAAAPAILSSMQLFYFGTFLPHRVAADAFADRHNARSSAFSWPVSLLTCFHFGYHHEHHLMPQVPWWDLPRARRRLLLGGAGGAR